MRAGGGAIIAFLMLGLPFAAQAQQDSGDFDLMIRGIKAATVSYSGQDVGGDYTVTARLYTTGFASLIKRLRYDGRATGEISAGHYLPASYVESADTGKRQSDATLQYIGGVPQVIAFGPAEPPQSGDVDPATMGGTIDPLTAVYTTFHAVEKGSECNLSLDLFDGKRASQLRVGAPMVNGQRVTCDGEYRRLHGFTPREMAKQPRFNFTLTYSPTGSGQMHVVEVVSETIYGKVTLKRR